MMQAATAAAAEAGAGPRPSVAKPPARHNSLSASGRLKYADPRSLPSYPSSGLSPGGAAASAAASLGWFSHKPIETWKPDKTSSASAAAVLAKDYKVHPAWEPVMDGTGAKAAVLAVGSASTAYRHSSVKKSRHDSWGNTAAASAFTTSANRPVSPEPTTLTASHGSSAATQAFQANLLQSAKVASLPPPSPREKPLAAAKGAMSPSRLGVPASRARSYSTPPVPSYADAKRASVSALNGASIAHQAAMNKPPEIEDTGAIPVTTMTRNMFTSHPPVKLEVDEQTTNERIHQSAVEMAKKMYQQQQLNRVDDSEDGTEGDAGPSANRFVNLQDAAYRQAQERLAKLQDEHEKNRQYHDYYTSEKPLRRRFTIMDRIRRRSASESDVEDRTRSDLVHQQMSLFTSQLEQVDEEKRERDREALLIAARRNVKASLQGMDEQHYFETGKVNPTILGDWQVRAQQAAQLRHDTRTDDGGRVDIGGGMFMDADEIDAIAARRVRPVLDDIHEKAEAERERLASLKFEDEAKKAEAERERDRERELKEIQKRAREEDKQQEKARRQQEKIEEKQRREDEKAAKAEQKRLAKEDKKKPKPQTIVTDPQIQESHPETQESPREIQDVHGEDPESRHEIQDVHHEDNEEQEQEQEAETQSRREVVTPERTITPTQEMAAATATVAPPSPPTATTAVAAPAPISAATDNAETSRRKSSSEAPTSPTARVKGWIKNRFSRGKSMSEHGEKKKSFIGGAALRGSAAGGSTASLGNRSSSIRDVTLAGRTGEETPVNHTAEIAREATPDIALEAPPEILPETVHDTVHETAPESVGRDSRGVSPVSARSGMGSSGKGSGRSNDIERFETPAAIRDPAPRHSNSPARDSRFREMMDH
ncbi:uncharacterized protein TrAtP1_011048 [Trichoderma atroviride]|uniref:uncharacterized protein n=1 Tax=Hypocrea atroviridis TaxID=63577 RepID=UPI0033237581|nr:hypothetical protein TrAtP1_011048 [Trichoderma atroviride]